MKAKAASAASYPDLQTFSVLLFAKGKVWKQDGHNFGTYPPLRMQEGPGHLQTKSFHPDLRKAAGRP